MEVLEKNEVKSKVQKAKLKTIQIKDDIGYYISRTPLFKMLQGKAKLYFYNPESLNEEISRVYNASTGEEGKKTVADMWQKIRELYFMVRDAINKQYNELPTVKIVMGVAVILYAIMPSDLVPDILPVLGFADDAALLAWFVKHAAKEISHYEQWKATQGTTEIAGNS